ncbi:DUF6882 domain-containing protein [Rothia uropygialis]|uniref:DUF6882 domain-containing protein n=1 Tax=Kocuria sp. 36 TaxID=1415402 RepID=UPI00101B66D9|nr:DUF6882 domain-containing protein [Kocuria sp. 36]
MTKTLQDLIDESIFISTEYQARLAELSGNSDWSVDFSAPSFTLESDPSVSLSPYLLGTESEQRGSWIWSWQELGHFPDVVVTSAVQAREAGEHLGVQELTTDELVLSEGLARRLTLAAKAVTGVFAHYPAVAGGGVRAWLLVDGPELELPDPTVNRMGRVMAEALQTNTAVHHQRAVDSYARLRGAHISWDTEACAVITATDGALRLWFDENKISGIEPAEPAVGQRELDRAAQEADQHRQALRDEARRALKIAQRESEQQRRAREEAEAQRVAATEAAVAPGAEQQPAVSLADTEGVERTHPEGRDLPFDQEPRENAEPGLVSTHVVTEEETPEPAVSPQVSQDEAVTDTHPIVEEPAESEPSEAQDEQGQPSALERLRAEQAQNETARVAPSAPHEEKGSEQTQTGLTASSEIPSTGEERVSDRRDVEPDESQDQEDQGAKKKGFFSRFFGL